MHTEVTTNIVRGSGSIGGIAPLAGAPGERLIGELKVRGMLLYPWNANFSTFMTRKRLEKVTGVRI